MEDGLLSLKWNNHKITFFEILRVLREKANFTDATIAVEGKFYPVHKLVMSTCSEYFSEIFERTPCKSPVIVLKDVRSQDMDALLDYMYLGEVNVNQNDLASLLKTAECLRIKGLAVPDEDPTKSRKAPSDDRRESPPPKRRRQEDPPAPAPPPRPVSPNISASSKTTPSTQTSPLQHQSSSLSVSHHQDNVQDSVLDPPPMVKVEMEDTQDPDDVYRRDNSYEGGSLNEGDGGDFGTELSKSEHDPDNYGSGSFPGPSIQPGGDLPWDEGDSSSFPPEGFSGDLPTGQQPQGGVGGDGEDNLDSHRPWLSSRSGETRIHSVGRANSVCGALNLEKQNLLLAIHAVAGGLMTGRQAAKAFSVPRTTLRRWMTQNRRLYPCPHCSYRATERSHLKKHLASRHRDLDNLIPTVSSYPEQNICKSSSISNLPDQPK